MAVSQVVGYIKGKSAIHMARVYGERRRNFVGQHFWARGYIIKTVGRDESGDPRLHWQPGERGSEARTDESLALKNATLSWPPNSRGASATPPTALSGSHDKAPGFAGGYLFWIPAFAGMTTCFGAARSQPVDSRSSGKSMADAARVWIPAFAGMTTCFGVRGKNILSFSRKRESMAAAREPGYPLSRL